MKTPIRWFATLALTCAFPLTALGAASTVSDVLNVQGNRTVTRGEFLRAGVIVFGLPVDFNDIAHAYRMYPEEYQPYAQSAGKQHALDALGRRPDLTQPITRGEALLLIAELKDWSDASSSATFRDVPDGTPLHDAVALGLEREWMKPLRTAVFGVSAPLRGREALNLLSRSASDNANVPKVIKIKITPKKQTPVDYTSEAFRLQIQRLLQNEYLYSERITGGTGATAEEFVQSLNDPYTTLLDPQKSKDFSDQLGGTLTGIGAHLEARDGEILIVSVVKGAPAERAGLKAGDVITTVDGSKTEGVSFTDVVQKIRGKEGTAVDIGIRRGNRTLSFDIIRAIIDIPDTSVSTRSNVAIVTVSQFGDHLLNDGRALFQDIAATNPRGVILDLRDNPGGYLDAVPLVVGAFLPDRSVYVRTKGKSLNQSFVTSGDPVFPEDVPLMVLTNEASASAAEIVAGALQDAGRATIVGVTSFGKGTVQTVYPFQNESSLKFTIAEWITPNGNPINHVGIEPDVVVQQSDAGDAQLEKALELILSSR